MAILLLNKTRETLGADASKCESRSLRFDRFGDPSAKDSGLQTPRKNWFQRIAGLRPERAKIEGWKNWLGTGLGLKPDEILIAGLQSRLMVNMAGGVMENAGLLLDRFGVPYVPGSAVKGCARRMAIQNLLEAGEGHEPPAKLAKLLADIAVIFGWGEQDWDASKKSDFAYAIGPALWAEVRADARSLLPETDHFGGAVSFLPAYPRQLPANDLELDVVTCHHPSYYEGEGEMPVALDIEDPNPVVFPAVAAGAVFGFVVLALRGERECLSQPGRKLHKLADEWLGQGLETFGLGAKTAAGYGWFKVLDSSRPAQAPSPGATRSVVALPSSPPPASFVAENPLVTQWRGKTQPGNFRAFRPLLAAVQDDAELKRVFQAIMPPGELANLKRANPYWQSFVSHPDGAAILKRLKLELR